MPRALPLVHEATRLAATFKALASGTAYPRGRFLSFARRTRAWASTIVAFSPTKSRRCHLTWTCVDDVVNARTVARAEAATLVIPVQIQGFCAVTHVHRPALVERGQRHDNNGPLRTRKAFRRQVGAVDLQQGGALHNRSEAPLARPSEPLRPIRLRLEGASLEESTRKDLVLGPHAQQRSPRSGRELSQGLRWRRNPSFLRRRVESNPYRNFRLHRV